MTQQQLEAAIDKALNSPTPEPLAEVFFPKEGFTELLREARFHRITAWKSWMDDRFGRRHWHWSNGTARVLKEAR